MSYTPPAGNAANVSWAGAASYTPPAGNAASVSWTPAIPAVRVALRGPLGTLAVLAWPIPVARAALPDLLAPTVTLYAVPRLAIVAPGPLAAPAIWLNVIVPRVHLAITGPLGAPAILATLTRRAPRRYRLTAYLSGGEDEQPDYRFHLQNFSLSKRSGAVSYYAITAPLTQELLAAFFARPNGKLHIHRDGYPWESCNVGHPIRYDRGAHSASLSISGSRQSTNAAPATLAITPAMVSETGIDSEGQLTLELVPGVIDPRPADLITWDGATYIVTLKKFRAGSDGQTLSINAVPT